MTRLPIALLALLGALPAGCGRREAGDVEGRSRRAGSRLAPDSRFTQDREVEVFEIPCTSRPEFVGSEVSGFETPAAAQKRSKRVARSALTSRLWLHPERLVWELPVLGGASASSHRWYLVMQPDSEVAALVHHGQRRYWADRPSQLAAWIEGSLRPLAPLERVEVLSRVRTDIPPGLAGAGYDAQRLERVHARLVPAADRGRRRSEVQHDVEAWSLRSPGLPKEGHALLWDFVLLPFADSVGTRRLAPLRSSASWPVFVGHGMSRPSEVLSAPAPRFFLALDLTGGRRRKVAADLLRLPPPGYQRMFGPITHQEGILLAPATAEPARERHKGDPRAGALQIKNPEPRLALVYADAQLVALVGPRARFSLGTLAPGYYRISAFGLFGTHRFGPRDLYVPGPVTLGE